MPQSPTVETRIDQAYAAIPVKVSMDELGSVVPPLTGQVFDWLADRGIRPAGPPFWRYVVVDMDADLELETGVAVASAVEGDERIRTGALPGGRCHSAGQCRRGAGPRAGHGGPPAGTTAGDSVRATLADRPAGCRVLPYAR